MEMLIKKLSWEWPDWIKVEATFKSNEQYIQDISDGNIESDCHKRFHESIREQNFFLYSIITNPLTDSHFDWLMNEIEKFFMRDEYERRENKEYCPNFEKTKKLSLDCIITWRKMTRDMWLSIFFRT